MDISGARHYVVVADAGVRPYDVVHVLELQDDLPHDSNGFASQFCEGRFRATKQLEGQYPTHSVFHFFAPTHHTYLALGTTVNGLKVSGQCVMETKKANEFRN